MTSFGHSILIYFVIFILPFTFSLWQNTDVYHNPSCSGQPQQFTSFFTNDCISHDCQAIDGKPNFWQITSCGNSRPSPIGNLNQISYYDSSCTTVGEYYSLTLSCQIGDDNHGSSIGCIGSTGTVTTYANGDCTGAVLDSSVIPLNQCIGNNTWTCVPGCSTHNCAWYQNCLEALHPCNTDNYALDYGSYFCSRYQDFANLLSPQAITWKDTVMVCLQNKLMDFINANPNFAALPCSSIKTYAFDSHPSCYTDSGACTLMHPSDWKAIAQIICGDRYCSLQGDKYLFLKQVLNTGMICLGKAASSISLTIRTLTTAYEAVQTFVETIEKLINSKVNSESAFSDRVVINAVVAPIPSSSQSMTGQMTLLATTQNVLFELIILPPFDTNTTSSNSSNSSSSQKPTNITSDELASAMSSILKENPMIVEGQEMVSLSVNNQTIFQPVSASVIVRPFPQVLLLIIVFLLCC